MTLAVLGQPVHLGITVVGRSSPTCCTATAAGLGGTVYGVSQIVLDAGQVRPYPVRHRPCLVETPTRHVALGSDAVQLSVQPLDLALRTFDHRLGGTEPVTHVVPVGLQLVHLRGGLLDDALCLGQVPSRAVRRGLGARTRGRFVPRPRGLPGICRPIHDRLGTGPVGSVRASWLGAQHDKVGFFTLLVHGPESDVLQRPGETPGPYRHRSVWVHHRCGQRLGETIQHSGRDEPPAYLTRLPDTTNQGFGPFPP